MGGSVYSMLFGNTNQGNAFDYFLKGQEAQQNYNYNQQVMQQRAQQMFFEGQKQPLELAQMQAQTDLLGQQQQTSQENLLGMQQTRQFNADMQPLKMTEAELTNTYNQGLIDTNSFNLENSQANAPLQRQQMQQNVALSRQNQTINNQTIATNQMGIDQARADKKAASYMRLGSLASSAKEMGAEGSPERLDFIKTVMPQIKKLGLDDELDFEAMASDGVSDAELDQVIGLANSLRGPKSGMELMKMQEQMLKNEKAQLDVNKSNDDKLKQNAENSAAASSQMAMIDLSTNTVDELLAFSDDVIDDATGAFEGTTAGQVLSSNIYDQDVANFKATVKTLQSQLTLANIDKLKGPTSDADLRLLAESVQSIDLTQNTPVLKKKFKEIQRLNNKIRKDVETKYRQAPSIPDTPAAKTTPEDFDAIMKGYGF